MKLIQYIMIILFTLSIVLAECGKCPGDAVQTDKESPVSKITINTLVTTMPEDGNIEAISHKELPREGGMWHPEREEKFVKNDKNRFIKTLVSILFLFIRSRLEKRIEEKPPWLLGQLEKFFSTSSIFLPGKKLSFFFEIIFILGKSTRNDFASGFQYSL